jgi:hypothetical protein
MLQGKTFEKFDVFGWKRLVSADKKNQENYSIGPLRRGSVSSLQKQKVVGCNPASV